jgi:hypothetical protein
MAFLVAVLFACNSKSAESKDKDPAPVEKTHVEVPGEVKTVGDPQPENQTDDPKKHIQPDEGTLEVGKPDCKTGAEATATIKVTPATGFHVSTDYPTELKLDPPAGVKLAKATYAKADADTLTEKLLQLSVKATPEKAGTYEIKGWFKFGVCDKDSCHPKKQPITIVCAAT